MARSLSVAVAVLVFGAVGLAAARVARAAPPGNLSVGVERLFGISRVTQEVEAGDATLSSTDTSVSLFSPVFSGRRGYSTPRLAFDYLGSSSVTFGGAFAYETISGDGGDRSSWLLAARLGYFARPSADFGVWPRGGLTHLTYFEVDGPGDDPSATALTFEVPLVFLVLGHSVGLTIMPYADIGIAGGTEDFDQTMTEVGLQFGMNAFF
jgi:hypothetical protein